MYKCRHCEKEFNPELVPFVNMVCWTCHHVTDRLHIKESYRRSPSIIERAYVQFIEAYEEANDIRLMPERVQTYVSDWRKQAGTEEKPFWEKGTTDDTEKGRHRPGPDDTRRRGPGL